MLADGDKVIARFTSRGTLQGDLMGIAPLSATFSKLHQRQEILDPILNITEKLNPEPSNFPQKANLTVPVEKWSEIAVRRANHESLRQLAHEFGVSHETIRQVLIKVRENAKIG